MAADQYTVVTSDDLGTFEDRINQLIAEGWLLQGGVAIATLPQRDDGCLHVLWSQAMVLSSQKVEALAAEALAFTSLPDADSEVPRPVADEERPVKLP